MQSSSAVADSYYLSGSLWFRIPTNDINFNLLSIEYQNGVGSFYIEGWSGTTRGYIGYYNKYLAGGYTAISALLSVPINTWHHLAFAIDVNHTGNTTYVGQWGGIDRCLLKLMFDGNKKSSPYFDVGNGDGNAFEDPPFSYHDKIKISGSAIGIPTVPNAIGGVLNRQPQMEFADYQLWTQLIDFTNPVNFAKVVKIANGKGTPVDPAVAAAAFGQQSILFKGDHTHFKNNLGTAGAFTQVGTSTDFLPGPSY